MITINKDACIGCGACARDCFPDVIDIVNGTAVAQRGEACIDCGHCAAVCPSGAVSVDGYDNSQVQPVSDDVPTATQLYNLIRQRRSIRRFLPEPLTDEQMALIIDAGRYTPTARNLQNTSYVVIRDGEKLRTLRGMALDRLAVQAQDMLKDEGMALRGKKLIAMRDDFKADPNAQDRLFFSAPAVILVVSDRDGARDAAAASQSMELMASALGLGVLFSGYFCAAASRNREIKGLLGIGENRDVVRCLVVGRPDVKYLNTTARKKAEVTFL